MSILFFTDDNGGEDVMLDTAAWEAVVEKLSNKQKFFYKESDSNSLSVEQLKDDIMPFLLKKTILNMKLLVVLHGETMDDSYTNLLKMVEDGGVDEYGLAHISYSEAFFISQYIDEVTDWMPLTFSTIVLPNRSNIEGLVTWKI